MHQQLESRLKLYDCFCPNSSPHAKFSASSPHVKVLAERSAQTLIDKLRISSPAECTQPASTAQLYKCRAETLSSAKIYSRCPQTSITQLSTSSSPRVTARQSASSTGFSNGSVSKSISGRRWTVTRISWLSISFLTSHLPSRTPSPLLRSPSAWTAW